MRYINLRFTYLLTYKFRHNEDTAIGDNNSKEPEDVVK